MRILTRLVALGAALAIPFAGLTLLGATPASATSPVAAQHVVVPAYFVPDTTGSYPSGGSNWDAIHSSNFGTDGDVAIANPASGPDYQSNPGGFDYAHTLQRAATDGARVVGYVDTGYLGTTGLKTRLGSTSIADWESQVMHDVNAWYAFYGDVNGASGTTGDNAMAGIFLDEGQNACGTGGSDTTYSDAYAFLTQYIHDNHPGSFVILNPGTAVPECYENSADTLATFEGPIGDYIYEYPNTDAGFTYQIGGSGAYQYYWQLNWTPTDPNKIMHIVYGVGQSVSASADLATVSADSKTAGAGYVYFTDEGGSGFPPTYSFLAGAFSTGTDSTFFADQLADAVGSAGESPTTPDTVDTYDVQYTTTQLNWGASTDCGGSAVVGYDVYVKNDTTSGAYLWAGSTPLDSYVDPDIYLTGLVAGDEYSAHVYARTLDGSLSSAGSKTWTQETDTDLEFGSTPGTPSQVSHDYTSEHLSWSASTGGSDAVLWYYLFQGGTLIQRLPGTQTTATVIGLTPDTSYTYTVQAEDTAGNMSSVSSGGTVTTESLPSGTVVNNISGSYSSATGDLTVTANVYEPFSFVRLYVDSNYGNESVTGFSANAFTPFFAGDATGHYGSTADSTSLGDAGNSWQADYVVENNRLYTGEAFNTGGAKLGVSGSYGDFVVSGLGSTSVSWTIPAPSYHWGSSVHVDVQAEGFDPPTNGGAIVNES